MKPPGDVPWANMTQATVGALKDFEDDMADHFEDGCFVPEPLPGAGKLYENLLPEELEELEKLRAALKAWQEYAEKF